MLKEKIKSISHPELVSGSKDCGFRIKSGMTQCETGRSMVEMLGVLAVIGVLSVAGIAGYSNAMNKHRANEILNEASKRAVVVAGQVMAGKTGEISLGEFGDSAVSGATFTKAEIKANHIVLTLSGSGLTDLCDQMKNATGDNTVMKITKDDCTEITFNADMSKNVEINAENEENNPTNEESEVGEYTCSDGKIYDPGENYIVKCNHGCKKSNGIYNKKVSAADDLCLCGEEDCEREWIVQFNCANGFVTKLTIMESEGVEYEMEVIVAICNGSCQKSSGRYLEYDGGTAVNELCPNSTDIDDPFILTCDTDNKIWGAYDIHGRDKYHTATCSHTCAKTKGIYDLVNEGNFIADICGDLDYQDVND